MSLTLPTWLQFQFSSIKPNFLCPFSIKCPARPHKWKSHLINLSISCIRCKFPNSVNMETRKYFKQNLQFHFIMCLLNCPFSFHQYKKLQNIASDNMLHNQHSFEAHTQNLRNWSVELNFEKYYFAAHMRHIERTKFFIVGSRFTCIEIAIYRTYVLK